MERLSRQESAPRRTDADEDGRLDGRQFESVGYAIDVVSENSFPVPPLPSLLTDDAVESAQMVPVSVTSISIGWKFPSSVLQWNK